MKDIERRLDDFLEKIAGREGQKELEKTERENGVGAEDEEMKPEDEAKRRWKQDSEGKGRQPRSLIWHRSPHTWGCSPDLPVGSPVSLNPASGSGLTEEQRKRSLLSDVRLAEEESQKAARRFEKDRVGADKRAAESSNPNNLGRASKELKMSRKSEKRKNEDPAEEEDVREKRVMIGEIVTNDELEINDWDDGEYVDQKTGEDLDPELAKMARLEEIKFMERIELYEEVPLEECWRKTGRPPISTKWVDVNKGTKERPDVRCRLVARDFKPKGEKHREDLFAAMPPLESKKLLFQKAVNENLRRRKVGLSGIKIMFIDVKKAHLNGVVEGDEVFIELPGEVGQEGKCGRLRRWLYGMRPAASAWEEHYSKLLQARGFRKGRAAPTAFFNSVTGVRCVVHGDEFAFAGDKNDLLYIKVAMEEEYELKMRAMLGDEADDDQEITILNRMVRWRRDGIRYGADPKHVETITNHFNLGEGSKGPTCRW